MQLTHAEELLMTILWEQERAFLKNLIEAYDDPKPATTTIATLLKRMQGKNFVDYIQYGRSREYFPLVKKKDYFSKHLHGIIKNFFHNNPLQFASFFIEETNFTKAELKEFKSIIHSELKKK